MKTLDENPRQENCEYKSLEYESEDTRANLPHNLKNVLTSQLSQLSLQRMSNPNSRLDMIFNQDMNN
jgi:hypothetical protein